MDASDLTPHLERFSDYETACREFKHSVPEYFNVASAILTRHRDAITRQALLEVKEDGVNTYTFGGLDYLSDKFASLMVADGFREGNVVATILEPSAALAITQLGTIKAGGAVLSIPQNSSHALEALAEGKAQILVCHEAFIEQAGELQKSLPALRKILAVRDLRPAEQQQSIADFWSEVDQASSDFSAVMTRAASPAFLFCEAGGNNIVKIAHTHSSIARQLAAFEMISDLEVDSAATWLTEDWHSVESLLSIIYPAWWYGASVLASNCLDEFETRVETVDATHAFISSFDASALSRMVTKPLRLLVTGALVTFGVDKTSNMFERSASLFATRQTGAVAATCRRWFQSPEGSSGRAVPGCEIEIQKTLGEMVPAGTRGEIVVRTKVSVDSQNGSDTGDSQAVELFRTGKFGFMNAQRDLFAEP